VTEQKSRQDVYIHISTASVFKVLLVALLAIFLYLIRDVLVMVVFAVVIASAISPAVQWLQERGLPRAFAVFLIYIALFLGLAGILFILIRPLAGELQNLSETLPAYFDRISLTVEEASTGSQAYQELLNRVQEYLSQVSGTLQSTASNIFAALARLFGGITSAVIVLVLSFYLAAQERGIAMFVRSVTPVRHQSYILNLWARAQMKMGRWVRGQAILSLIVGLLVFIGLTIFGIRFSLLLALLAALFEIIPFVGPILAAIPAVALALLKSPVVALWTVLVYVIVQQLENAILAPKIMQRAVGLNPVIVILSLLIGGQLLGVAGIIIAVPVAAVAAEILRDIGDKAHGHDPIRA
jgi:predicted PurR-regulated permease PerM